jgi:hypothetical protein
VNETKLKAISDFCLRAEELTHWLVNFQPKKIVLLHHNDADGISAGAILSKALYRAGFNLRRIALEKPYPAAIERIIESIDNRSQTLLLFTDFASGMLQILDDRAPADLQILVLDHHQLVETQSKRIQNLNPLSFSISGGTECCAATVCYLFAKALNSWNEDLAGIALAGVYGDGQYQQDFSLIGLNQLVLLDAERQGLFSSNPVPELITKKPYALADIVRSLNALGSIGYFEGGVDIALKGLADGWGVEADIRGKEYQQRFQVILNEFFAQVTLHQVGRLTWFTVPDGFPRVGVKTVGLLCEELIRSGRITGERYVLGIQPIPPLALGFGELLFDEDKVSMRTTPELSNKIAHKQALSLVEVLPSATLSVAGFVDACHPNAAATTIPRAKREQFLSLVSALTSIENSHV